MEEKQDIVSILPYPYLPVASMALGLFFFIVFCFPIADILDSSSYEDGIITHGCKLSYGGIKSTCYDSYVSFEKVTVKYPFLVTNEYSFYDGELEKYNHHRIFLFEYLKDKELLNKKFPNAKNSILTETKKLFQK